MPKTTTAPQARALRDPVDILEQLAATAAEFFNRTPELITTDRRGRYESGWTRPHPSDPLTPVGLGKSGCTMATRQRLQVHMAALATEYADHPRARPELVHRDPEFPASITLRLTTCRSAQIGDAA